MDPDPLRLLETAPPLRSSTLSANPANSRFSVREDRRLASSEAVNKIPQKTLTDQLRSLVLRRRPRKGRSFPARESLPNSILAHPTTSRERAGAPHLFEDEDDDEDEDERFAICSQSELRTNR